MRASLSFGLCLLLVIGLDPASAADGTDVSGVATGIGLFAALWALLDVGGAMVGTGSVVAAAGGIVALASAAWLWRFQRARVGASRHIARRGRGRTDTVSPARRPVSIPVGLDGEEVLDAVRGRFLRLQQAWDAGDVATLQSLTTPDMLDELMHVLGARGGPSRTDVVSLHAELLGLEELSAAYLASVEFSGLIRESAEKGAVPFRELWMLASVKGEAPSWRLARQQSLF